MRAAMAEAAVGDDVFREDPTVNQLEKHSAALFGKEAALFVPSGTMGNLLALLAQTQPGDTILLHEAAHIYRYEAAGCARIAGLMTRTLASENGLLDPDRVRAAIVHTPDLHRSNTRLIAIENTMNMGGGTIYPPETIDALAAVAQEFGIALHCDGARIFNAAVAAGITPADFSTGCDTVMFCLSKGLGCPVGSLLCGDRETIERARRHRKLLGGGMRQTGILAAAGIYALEHHVARLADDHARASSFGTALAALPGVTNVLPFATNMVLFDVLDAPRLANRLREHGILLMALGPSRMRAVFNLDVDDDGLERACSAMTQATTELF